MKNLKKKLAGILIFAMVLGIMAPGMTTTVQAAEELKIDVTADYAEEVVELEYPASMAAIYFADTKVDVKSVDYTKTTKEDANWKIKTWEVVEGVDGTATAASIDISWVKKNKAANIVFKFVDKNGNEYYQGLVTPVQETKLKVGTLATATGTSAGKDKSVIKDENPAKGDKETGYLYFYTDKGVVSASSIQWRKGTTGEWKDIDTLASKLPMFKAKGATLYFRTKGTETAWPSKEAKFSYKKQANAPKVKVDVSKYTLSVKDTMEYKLELPGSDWVAVPDKTKAINILDLKMNDKATKGAIQIYDGLYTEHGVKVLVRTEANGAKGTIPSKTTELTLKSVSPATITVATTTALATKGLVVNYLTPYDDASGISIKNYTDVEYEYMLVTSGTSIDAKVLDPAKELGKWAKIGKGASDKAKEVKIKDDKVPDNAVVLLRLVGDKKEAELAGKIKEINVTNEVKELVQGATAVMTGNDTLKATVTATAIDKDGVITITVSGNAVSGQAVTAGVDITFSGLVSEAAKLTDITDCDEVEVTAKAAVAKKVSVKLNIPASAACTKEASFTIEGMKIKVKLDIKAATK